MPSGTSKLIPLALNHSSEAPLELSGPPQLLFPNRHWNPIIASVAIALGATAIAATAEAKRFDINL